MTSEAYRHLKELILVPGHAVYGGTEADHAIQTTHWQGTFPGYRDNDEALLYTAHIRAGVEEASKAEKQHALLLFSGGQTRKGAGPFSESQSYWRLADQCGWFGYTEVRERASTEEFARDSFENLLFALYRFQQCTSRFPIKLTVCGFAFKAQRYHDHYETIMHHRPLLGLGNAFEFHYIGVNDPPDYLMEGANGSREGETRTRAQFADDPFGTGEVLSAKRLQRDPFERGNPYKEIP